MIYLVQFTDGDHKFIAFGENRNVLPVYSLGVGGGPDYSRTEMTFPSCLKFLHGADDITDAAKTTAK